MDEYDQARLDQLEASMKRLNREMGEVLGELRWIRWLLMGVLAAAIGQFILP